MDVVAFVFALFAMLAAGNATRKANELEKKLKDARLIDADPKPDDSQG